MFKAALTVTAPDSIHIGTKFPVGISGAGSLDVSWGVKFGGRPITLDSNTGFLSNDGGDLALFDEGTYTITATARDDAGNLTSAFANITVTNTAPSAICKWLLMRSWRLSSAAPTENTRSQPRRFMETLNKSRKQRKKWYTRKKGGEETWDR